MVIPATSSALMRTLAAKYLPPLTPEQVTSGGYAWLRFCANWRGDERGRNTITPELAHYVLWEQNRCDRDYTKGKIDGYIRDHKADRFTDDTAIKLDKDNALNDGGHRTYMVFVTGKPLDVIVIPDGHWANTDTGNPRTPAQYLTSLGYPHGDKFAAALRWVEALLVLRDEGKFVVSPKGGVNATRRMSNSLTHEDYKPLAEAHEGLLKFVEEAEKLRHKAHTVPGGLLLASRYLTAQIDWEDSDWFFGHLADDYSLKLNHPILLYRERLAKNKSADTKNRFHQDEHAGLILKTWNIFRTGEHAWVTQLKWRSGGATPEKIRYFI